MALAIFDARPTRVQVGDLFDTEKQYLYRSYSSTLDASLVKFATSATVVGQQSSLTYRFDGAEYYVNTNLPFTPSLVIFGMT